MAKLIGFLSQQLCLLRQYHKQLLCSWKQTHNSTGTGRVPHQFQQETRLRTARNKHTNFKTRDTLIDEYQGLYKLYTHILILYKLQERDQTKWDKQKEVKRRNWKGCNKANCHKSNWTAGNSTVQGRRKTFNLCGSKHAMGVNHINYSQKYGEIGRASCRERVLAIV